MGMYDDIIVNLNLPLPEEVKNLNFDWHQKSFQTKDLENCLLLYYIKEDGLLYEHVLEQDFIPFTPEENKNRKSTFPLWKEVILKNEYNKKIDFHGTITFYTYEDFDDNYDFWLEFRAFLVYGKVDKIELVSFKKEPSRKLSNQEHFKNLEKKQSTFSYKCKSTLSKILGWRWFWSNSSKFCYKLSTAFTTINNFIIRRLL